MTTMNFNLEIKSLSEDGLVEGYASTFGNLDRVGDVVTKGAFTKSIANEMPQMLWNHNPDFPVGVWETIREDEKGLFVTGRIATKTAMGADVYELVKLGAVKAMSIGYNIKSSTRDKKSGVNYLNEIALKEVSFVVFPANPEAKLTGVKSDDELDSLKAMLNNRSELLAKISFAKENKNV